MQRVPGYETITGTTPTPASVCCQSSVKFSSVILAVVEDARSRQKEVIRGDGSRSGLGRGAVQEGSKF